jgi:cell division protein FtsI (penicillin-binding protein 3)
MVTVQTRSELRISIRVCALLFVVGFAIIGARAWFLQIVSADELRGTLERQYRTSVLLSPKRGTIYDRNGNELAISIEVESLSAHPHLISDAGRVSASLAGILNMPVESVAEKLREDKPFVWIARKITSRQAQAVRDLHEPGLEFIKESTRSYPNGELAAQVLGFTGVDSDGLEGLEFRLNETLRGTPQRVAANRDAHGRRLFSDGFCSTAQDDGSDVYLTIDKNIQYIAEKELSAAVAATGARGGIAIVMDPWSGDVLAMAVAPLFDPNRYAHYRPEVWRNRAIADVLEPGSTFKIFVVAAALEENIITPEDIFFCENGQYRVANRTIRDVKPHGWLNVAHIIKYSSNIGVSKISKHLGTPAFYQYIRTFGFAHETGIQLPGEAVGSVPSPARLPEHTRNAIAFGHSISVTPLQLAQAYSAIANGGVLIRPTIVKRIRSPESGNVQNAASAEVQRVINPVTAGILTDMLHTVVEEGGTGMQAAVPGYSVAGKTGTSRKLHNGTYCSKRLVASFAGFCPADNPRATIVVIIDEPQSMSNGGQSAAPAFSRIAQQVMNYLNVAPNVRIADGAGARQGPVQRPREVDRSG